jgi:hypothetical protein
MVIDACRPEDSDRNVHQTSRWTSSCEAAKPCGVNSAISMLSARSRKKLATPVLPVRCPYHGAAWLAASAAQSTSSQTRSRMASTSPRPMAS